MAAAFRGILFVVLVALYIVKRGRSKRLNNVPFPPGPKGYPLLGAVLSIDASKPWFTYSQWRKVFGRYHVQSHRALASLIHSRRPHLHTYLQYGCSRHKLRKNSS